MQMVCVNPDKITVSPSGTHTYVPGLLGIRYAELGGEVKYFGKPYQDGFQECLDTLQLNKASVAHVGDSLEHDVQGATTFGVASVFIASGVHGKELACEHHTSPEALSGKSGEMLALFEESGHTPTHVMPAFVF
jgi:ribonucleotide monophosphatase NagD (HAD superfamily)